MQWGEVTIEQLVQHARLAAVNAYAPYSHHPVGAALVAGSGQIYTGCNVENAAYGLTTCAERTAIVKAVSAGERQIQALAVIGPRPEILTPCGLCRQLIAEFSTDAVIIMANSTGDYQVTNISELLPSAFRLEK